MDYNDHLHEAAALAHTVQVQLLLAVVFMAKDPDQSLAHVRQLAALRRRLAALVEHGAAATVGHRRTERTRL
jgi:hypothetical protein